MASESHFRAGGIFWQRADGSGGPERLCCDGGGPCSSLVLVPGRASDRGGWAGGAGGDLSVFRRGDSKVQVLIQTPFARGAMFSPDGRLAGVFFDETGRSEIYVQPYPGPGGKWQISTEGGTEPLWNRNGRELFYRSGDRMMAVDITTQPGFSAGKPKLLFEGPYEPTLTNANYDVSPDGQRFLMLKAGETEAAPTQINVVLNWFEELKRRVPTN